MKRRAFIRELEAAGCEFVRHGRRHDLYRNPATGRQAPVPRHREIADSLCEVIRKQLGLGGADASAEVDTGPAQ
jgi:mRNA interferase HicA